MTKLVDLVRRCDCFPYRRQEIIERYGNILPLVVEGQVVGLLLPKVVEALSAYPSIFNIEKHQVTFNPQLDTSEARSKAIQQCLLDWKASNTFTTLQGWRNELYPAYLSHTGQFLDLKSPTAFTLERAGAPIFGVTTYGVHVNIYTVSSNGLVNRMWIARRSPTKPTWPNYLDNAVAGGITYGYTARDTVIKECMEEANLSSEWAEQAQMVGAISYFTVTERGLAPEVQFVFDLPLPEHVKLTPNDGEVGEFHLWDMSTVREKLDEFKPNCGLVVIDFLIRHGLITADNEPGYLEIQQRLHRPLFFQEMCLTNSS
jgi:8-oxo-dGTP pyrophosphatase MutT (NUDIX family)